MIPSTLKEIMEEAEFCCDDMRIYVLLKSLAKNVQDRIATLDTHITEHIKKGESTHILEAYLSVYQEIWGG